MARLDVEGGEYGTTGAADSGNTDSSGDIMDSSGMPFTFNPPLHPHARFWRADLSTSRSDAEAAERAAIYDETRNQYGKEALSGSKFTDLRLGRIVMGNQAMSWALMDADTRYGFRFLYNPETVSRGANVGTNFIPDPGNTLNFMLQEGLEKISFQLLLNRIPDVNGPAKRGDYVPKAISEFDMKQIRRRGTHYDLEYLYRVANGLQHTRVRKNTGDIGILLPNPCWLVLGGQKTRGALYSIEADDQMFSEDLVPILTYVTVTFARYLTFKNDDYSKLESVGITQAGGGADLSDTGDSDTDTSEPSGNYSGATLTGRQIYDLSREVGFTPSQAEIMANIAWGESSWRTAPNPHPPCCWGLFQINWDANSSIVKSFGGTKAEDLHDPVLNAKSAKKIFDDAGGRFNPWEAWRLQGWGNWKWKWRR